MAVTPKELVKKIMDETGMSRGAVIDHLEHGTDILYRNSNKHLRGKSITADDAEYITRRLRSIRDYIAEGEFMKLDETQALLDRFSAQRTPRVERTALGKPVPYVRTQNLDRVLDSDEALFTRNEAVYFARKEGLTLEDIAEHTDLTHDEILEITGE